MWAMQMRSRTRHHWTAAEKAELIAAYQRSGLSQRDFALRQGIAPSNLPRWVRQAQAAGSPLGAALVEVPNLLAPAAETRPYRLHFAKGLALEVARGFVPEEVLTLAQLLQRL